MDIELFDKRYVYLEWSDELEEKDCILAKTYQDLKDFVNSGDEDRFCKAHKGKEKPFTNLWSECDFCYYDPNLKVKKGWLEGKTIQKLVLNEWEDYIINLPRTSSYFYNINWDAHNWRIKPTETWYVIFAENSFLRVSMINYEFNTVFFKGTYEECGKWIDEHDSLSSVFSAFLRGDTIQWKLKNRINEWQDWKSSEFPTINTMDENYWRIKPEYNFDNIIDYKPRCYLSINKNDSYLEFTISQNIINDTIYSGTRKECERMMKIIGNEFEEEDLSHWNISYRLRYIIDKYSHEKYKRRMTNRELSEWLAKGNGEVKNLRYIIDTSTSYCYKNNTENENVDDNILIRDFGSDEWRPPLIEV